MTTVSRSAWTAFIVPAGGVLIAGLIIQFGFWIIPGLVVVVVTALGLLRIEWGLYGLLFLLPFTAVEGRVSEAIVQDFKRVLVVAIAAAWLVHLVVERRAIRIPRWMLAPILVLCTAAVLSVFRAPDRAVALSSTSRLLAYILVYVVIVTDVLSEPDRIWRAVRVLLASATLTAGFALYQLAAYFKGWPAFLSPAYQTEYAIPRVHGFMQEPLWLSNYLLMVFPVAFALFSWRQRRWPVLTLIAGVSSTAGIIIAASRLGWAALLITGSLFILLAGRALRPGLVGRLLLTLVVLVMPFVALWARSLGSPEDLFQYLKAFATFDSSEHGAGDLKGHLQNLSLIGDALRVSPIIGIGTNNIGFRFYADLPIAGPQISTTHNTYLDVLIETGGAGLLSFAVLLVAALTSAWRGFRSYFQRQEGGLCFGVCMGIVGMSLHLTNWSGWREAHIWFALGLAFAIEEAFRREHLKKQEIQEEPQLFLRPTPSTQEFCRVPSNREATNT